MMLRVDRLLLLAAVIRLGMEPRQRGYQPGWTMLLVSIILDEHPISLAFAVIGSARLLCSAKWYSSRDVALDLILLQTNSLLWDHWIQQRQLEFSITLLVGSLIVYFT